MVVIVNSESAAQKIIIKIRQPTFVIASSYSSTVLDKNPVCCAWRSEMTDHGATRASQRRRQRITRISKCHGKSGISFAVDRLRGIRLEDATS